MLTENIQIKDDLDCKTLENLYNKQFYISKEDKPIEKIIDASNDIKLDVKAEIPNKWDFKVNATPISHIHADRYAGHFKNYDNYRENLTVNAFHHTVTPYPREKVDTSFQKKLFGLNTDILKNYHSDGGVSEFIENENKRKTKERTHTTFSYY